MLAEEIVDIQQKYQSITLNFGKNKGKSLKEIINEKDGPDYLIWLHKQMKQDTTKEKTPTQKAIMRYISAVYDL